MDWELTATTLYCETLKKWVPIMVHKDGRTNCGYFYRHRVVTHNRGGMLQCHGPEGCSLCETYKQDVFQRTGQMTQDR